jgi:hypothetical protein
MKKYYQKFVHLHKVEVSCPVDFKESWLSFPCTSFHLTSYHFVQPKAGFMHYGRIGVLSAHLCYMDKNS